MFSFRDSPGTPDRPFNMMEVDFYLEFSAGSGKPILCQSIVMKVCAWVTHNVDNWHWNLCIHFFFTHKAWQTNRIMFVMDQLDHQGMQTLTKSVIDREGLSLDLHFVPEKHHHVFSVFVVFLENAGCIS